MFPSCHELVPSGLAAVSALQLPALQQVTRHWLKSGGLSWLSNVPRGASTATAAGSAPTSSEPTTSAIAGTPAAPQKLINVTVNGKAVRIPAKGTLFDALQQAKVYVPTLCKHPRLPNTPGTCRVCMVEADGRVRPACCTPAWDGVSIATDTPEVKTTVRGTLALLRANHPEDCMSCDVNGRCEFQDLISLYNVPKYPKLKEVSPDYIEHSSHWHLYDQSSYAIKLDLDKCIKCGRCVTTCEEVQGMNVLGMFHRGRDRHIGFVYETDMDLSKCIECGQCVSVCPVGALSERTEWREVLDLLHSREKVMVVETAPAVRVAIGEEMGLAPGAVTTGQMVAGLRRLGFDYVFDTDFSADLTIMEEGFELIGRLKYAWGLASKQEVGGHVGPLPMFTSCCPAWVNLVEKDFPELAPHLSSAKSPQQMMGAVVKEYWAKKAGVPVEDVVLVSVMPCTAKKHEAERPEMVGEGGVRHVDYVLTTRELGRLFRHKKISMAALEEEQYDQPLGSGSGAAVLFGNTGGVMEAAVRTVYETVSGQELPNRLNLEAVRGLHGVKEATLQLPLQGTDVTKTVKVAVCSGIINARRLVEQIRAGQASFDFVEVMSCPGGCIGGGGQPKTKGAGVLQARMQAVYDIDARAGIRKSHENPDVQSLYQHLLGQPNSPLALQLLHTRYKDKSHGVQPGYSDSEKHEAAVPEEVERAKRAEAIIPGPPKEVYKRWGRWMYGDNPV